MPCKMALAVMSAMSVYLNDCASTIRFAFSRMLGFLLAKTAAVLLTYWQYIDGGLRPLLARFEFGLQRGKGVLC